MEVFSGKKRELHLFGAAEIFASGQTSFRDFFAYANF